MDFLQSLFNQDLNSEGEIDIRGYTFPRDKVLIEMDKVAYEDLFNQWKEERKQQKLERANQLLLIADNEDRFMRLKELYKNNKVVPFIGAGLSMPSGLPSWKDFLYKVQKESGVNKDDFKKLIDNGEYENAAQLLHDTDAQHLQEKLENFFGKKFVIDDIQGVVRRLPEWFKDNVITTNYDDILSVVYEESGEKFTDTVLGFNAEEILSDRKSLIKIHGEYKGTNKRILTSNDYKKYYTQEKSIEHCIMKFMMSNHMLFLGCSLNTDRTIRCMEKIRNECGEMRLLRQYAFLCSGNLDEATRVVRRQELQKSNIYPIWYDGDHDDDIEALLEKLVE